MAKAGILALTRSAAIEYGPQRIRVNALVAGGFRTSMPEGVIERAGGSEETRAAIEKRFTEAVPLGRIGRPEEAAEAGVCRFAKLPASSELVAAFDADDAGRAAR